MRWPCWTRRPTKLCALRSTPPIERARAGLQDARAEVAFAEFELAINESTTVFGDGPPRVLVHAKFQQGEAAADRVAVVLAHEGAHVAAGGRRTPPASWPPARPSWRPAGGCSPAAPSRTGAARTPPPCSPRTTPPRSRG